LNNRHGIKANQKKDALKALLAETGALSNYSDKITKMTLSEADKLYERGFAYLYGFNEKPDEAKAKKFIMQASNNGSLAAKGECFYQVHTCCQLVHGLASCRRCSHSITSFVSRDGPWTMRWLLSIT
jgi:hypothetical protein